jgi:hypothetical protein
VADQLLADLCDDLVENSLGAAVATDVFYDEMPDGTPSPTVCLYNNGGPGEQSLAPSPVRSIGVRVRAQTYIGAYVRAQAIYDLWHNETGYQLDNTKTIMIVCEGYPASIGRDDRDRALVAFNITCKSVDYADPGGPAPCAVTITSVDVDPITRTAFTTTFTTNSSKVGTIYYRKNGQTTWLSKSGPAATSHSIKVIGLAQGTQYDMYIEADCAVDPIAAPGAWHTVTTASAVEDEGTWVEVQ